MSLQGAPSNRRQSIGRLIRDGWRPWLTSRAGVSVLSVIVVAALVATLLPNATPLPPVEPTGSPTPTATPGSSVPPADAWADLALPDWQPIAELDPVEANASGVAVASAFVLRSRSAIPAVELAAGLTAEPAVDFRVRPGASPAEARVEPVAPLMEGVLYRFRLADPTGALAGSWAFRTERPLHVVGTVPTDQSTGVPADTGIEVEFDQDGVTDISAQFSISPEVAGRFEVHGRTVVFVPTEALGAATIYRVAIAPGVTMAGSDQVLDEPVTFAFETSTGGRAPAWDIVFGRSILEASPREQPLIAVQAQVDNQSPAAPTDLPFEVYRLPSFDAARAAALVLAAQDDWGQWASVGLVPTEGLARVASFKGIVDSESPYGYRVIRFPAPLAAGWYLVVVPREGRDRQALLQVTDLTAFALTSDTRTIAWVNDRESGAPVAGAILADPGGIVVGTTGPNGLLDVETPGSLRPAPDDRTWRSTPSVVSIEAPDGRRLLLPLGLPTNTEAYRQERQGWSWTASPSQRWWLLLSTDRGVYRTTDTIHAWGTIRSREDGSVPSELEVTLRHYEASSTDGPWLARVPVTATSRGTWAADLEVEGLPIGEYILELHAAGVAASSLWIQVAEIRKPAYRIDVETDLRAAIAGDPVAITARSVFFDGTAAAGLAMLVEAFGETRTLTADSGGGIALTLPARSPEASEMSFEGVFVAPADPEEGQISGYADVVVFPSRVWLAGSGAVRDGRVVVDGMLTRVDLARVEADLAEGRWPEDPAGAPVAGGTVTVRIVEQIPVTRQTGTAYDYIEKRVIPLFEYTIRERTVGTYTARSDATGKISLRVPAPSAEHAYTITLTARDELGRRATRDLYASPTTHGPEFGPQRPYLGRRNVCGYSFEEHAVGETISLTMHDSDGTPSASGQFLFVVAARGVRDAVVQADPTLIRAYGEADLPSLGVFAVHYLDGTYVVTDQVQIRTRKAERTLGVELTADRARYKPGDRATVTVATTDPDGRPVAADVVIRGVDEKLFEMGAALDIDALAQLLSPTGDGLIQSYASHPLPMPENQYGCGDTTGGGGRDDFRDSVVFELISTGPDGHGRVSFDLPDDLTSWHVSATAIAADLRAGSGALLVPVGLPFFADAILASDYLAGERPVLRVRSYGDDLAAGDRVRFTVSAPSLLLPPTEIDAAAYASATLQLPDLPLGTHDVTIRAAVIGDPTRTDALVRRVVVRSSRLEIATTEVTTPERVAGIGGSGLTTFVVTDAGRGSLVPILQDLAHGGGARFDRLLAADLAHDLLVGTFGFDPASLPPVDLDVARYQRTGIALLPYSSGDLALTAMAAIVAPERLAAGEIRQALWNWSADASTTRERQIIAMAGLAGLGEDVLAELRAFDVGAVTVREALWVALGLVAAGDENSARTIERMLLERYGQELGPWVRLDVGKSMVDTLDAASLLALVAAGIGDPLAPRVDRYVRGMRTTEALYVLPEIGVVRWSLDRLPRAAARFAWTVDGHRQVETLEPGASWSVPLTERQREGFRVEVLEGTLAVVVSWTRAPGEADLPSGHLVSITRTVTPVDDAPTTGLVKVRLRVVFEPTAPAGCWEVTDRTPSGLSPVAAVAGWPEHQDGERSVIAPYEVAGQQVAWCLYPTKIRDFTLGYSARVVSAGTFAWEPAVVQSVSAPDVGATTPRMAYTIR
jgi:hypothetical protein